MSVFFSSESTPDDPQLANLWHLLENEHFHDAVDLAEDICRDSHTPVEFFCGLSLAYGEIGYYDEAEQVARTAVSFGESHWRARHALAVALMHQGRFLGAVDSLGFYRDPVEIYVVRAQVEKMGSFIDGLKETLQDALQKDCPPAIALYLAYLYGSLGDDIPGWPGRSAGFAEVARYGEYLDVWERDLARHKNTPYGKALGQHVAGIRHMIK
jgi:hypothetical protein